MQSNSSDEAQCDDVEEGWSSIAPGDALDTDFIPGPCATSIHGISKAVYFFLCGVNLEECSTLPQHVQSHPYGHPELKSGKWYKRFCSGLGEIGDTSQCQLTRLCCTSGMPAQIFGPSRFRSLQQKPTHMRAQDLLTRPCHILEFDVGADLINLFLYMEPCSGNRYCVHLGYHKTNAMRVLSGGGILWGRLPWKDNTEEHGYSLPMRVFGIKLPHKVYVACRCPATRTGLLFGEGGVGFNAENFKQCGRLKKECECLQKACFTAQTVLGAACKFTVYSSKGRGQEILLYSGPMNATTVMPVVLGMLSREPHRCAGTLILSRSSGNCRGFHETQHDIPTNPGLYPLCNHEHPYYVTVTDVCGNCCSWLERVFGRVAAPAGLSSVSVSIKGSTHSGTDVTEEREEDPGTQQTSHDKLPERNRMGDQNSNLRGRDQYWPPAPHRSHCHSDFIFDEPEPESGEDVHNMHPPRGADEQTAASVSALMQSLAQALVSAQAISSMVSGSASSVGVEVDCGYSQTHITEGPGREQFGRVPERGPEYPQDYCDIYGPVSNGPAGYRAGPPDAPSIQDRTFPCGRRCDEAWLALEVGNMPWISSGSHSPPSQSHNPYGSHSPPSQSHNPYGTYSPPSQSHNPYGTYSPPSQSHNPCGTYSPPSQSRKHDYSPPYPILKPKPRLPPGFENTAGMWPRCPPGFEGRPYKSGGMGNFPGSAWTVIDRGSNQWPADVRGPFSDQRWAPTEHETRRFCGYYS
ncbi:protein IF [Gallid alphaherpesvirus 1]|nr:protein IF [Gallid alphaherpesvirus 1]